MLVLVFAVNRGWLPSVSLVAPGENPLSTPEVLVLPVATLLLAGLAYMQRMVRAGMVEVMASDYVEMARLNGVAERPRGRAVRPAQRARPGRAGDRADAAVARRRRRHHRGAVRLPGIGEGLVQAVTARDGPLIQSVALVIALFYIMVNVVADV